LLLDDHEDHHSGGHYDAKNDQQYFFHLQRVLQISSYSVYAIAARAVPNSGENLSPRIRRTVARR
jgi:hypothetical protein